jgi:hypothetical protein
MRKAQEEEKECNREKGQKRDVRDKTQTGPEEGAG